MALRTWKNNSGTVKKQPLEKQLMETSTAPGVLYQPLHMHNNGRAKKVKAQITLKQFAVNSSAIFKGF